MTAPSLLDELEEVVAYAWRKDGMKGWALGHNPPTQNMLDFDKYEVRELAFRTHHAEIAAMANELRVARESFKRCDEICKCTAEGWRTAEEDMAKRLEAAERDAARWRVARNNTGDGLRLVRWNHDACEELQVMFPSPVLCDSDADAAIDAATQEGKG
jgi:hypothetical protein